MRATTPPAPTMQQTSSSTTTSGMAILSMMGTTSGQIDDTQKPSSSDDNTALIGGIVGGVVALLIVVGVIGFIVLRNRKAKDKANQQRANDGHALSPPAVLAQPTNGNYDRIDIPSPSNYSDKASIQQSPGNHYDSLSPSEI
jgi:hypothetical protein